MKISSWIRQNGGTILTGIFGALLISSIIGKWWPEARSALFYGLSVFWLLGAALAAFRDWQSARTQIFEDPQHWDPSELPGEYRLITHGITRGELISTVGEYRYAAHLGIGRYDLPSGGAIFVYIETPVTDNSLITGVQYYPGYGQVPVLPL
jgi:hypothetical protein